MKQGYVDSLTAAFAVIGILWLSKTGAVGKIVQWVRQTSGVPAAAIPPSAPPASTTSSGGTGPGTRGVTGG